MSVDLTIDLVQTLLILCADIRIERRSLIELVLQFLDNLDIFRGIQIALTLQFRDNRIECLIEIFDNLIFRRCCFRFFGSIKIGLDFFLETLLPVFISTIYFLLIRTFYWCILDDILPVLEYETSCFELFSACFSSFLPVLSGSFVV